MSDSRYAMARAHARWTLGPVFWCEKCGDAVTATFGEDAIGKEIEHTLGGCNGSLLNVTEATYRAVSEESAREADRQRRAFSEMMAKEARASAEGMRAAAVRLQEKGRCP